jgi:hypothetical protein
VPHADDLAEAQMRAIAREFNQSGTTFLLRPGTPGATWRLRSFTPIGAEVYGAGHNPLGAWPWLAGSAIPSRGSPRARPSSSRAAPWAGRARSRSASPAARSLSGSGLVVADGTILLE